MADLSSTAASAVEDAAEVVEQVIYTFTDANVTDLYTLLSGLVTVQLFTLLAQLVLIGIALVVVFVIALRRF